ncbi:uncharacterized protein LOC120417249 [Culex pipiens pallens]|uniref:uncharacterized protein LOC120417249 n=1 Tax=Culex pipiens pallens TaxID=42434 RepID=UPI001952E1F9|nr:uncharacterized protein LOC120417249 [Culex pipiens pallens]
MIPISLVSLTVVVLLQFINVQALFDVPGTVNVSLMVNSCDDGKRSICSNCTTFSLCLGGKSIGEIPCGSATPHCVQGDVEATCSDHPASECDVVERPWYITCPSVGVLPDPVHCDHYHNCSQRDSPSELFQCPPGYIFNTVTQTCRSRSVQKCAESPCRAANTLVPYGPSHMYYVLCVPRKESESVEQQLEPYIFRCPDRAPFNVTTQACEYRCVTQGNFADSLDLNSYFQCYRKDDGGFVALKKGCQKDGDGMVAKFNATVGECIP